VLHSESHGNFALRYVTIQNGRNDGSAGGGLQVMGTGADSSVVLGINILRNNTSDFADSVGFIDVEGTVHVNGNLIVDNTTPAAGGLSIDAGANALVYVTNNTIANNTNNLVSLRDMNKVVSLDTATNTVTIEAGLRYGDFAPYLDEHGYAVANLASLPHITVAGACATATHGSGIKNGNLSTAVAAIEFVNAAGDIITLSKKKDGDAFYGAGS